MSIVEERLRRMGIVLPNTPPPVANYAPWVVSGNLIYVSGQIPMTPQGIQFVGIVGKDFDREQGYEAAKLCGINVLAQAKAACGNLDRVTRVVKLSVFVNAVAGYKEHPEIANGASDLMVGAFEERIGKHARAAVGAGSLPRNVATEVEAVIEFQ